MAAETFGDVWRTMRLHAPGAPVFLVMDWCQRAWKQLGGRRGWSFLRGELDLSIIASRSPAVVVTLGSASVTSTGAFVSTDLGRQFRIASYPTYTIIGYTDASHITLDRTYGDASGAATALIYDGYYTAPADFGRFILIGDPYNQRRLAFWIDQDQLNVLDPTRQAGDSGPRCLASQSPSTLPSTIGQIRYEYWPRPTAQRTYPALYEKQPTTLTDDTAFGGVLMNRATEVLILGALAQCCRWRGTVDTPNPLFDLGSARGYQDDFEKEVQRLGLQDDDHYSSDLSHVHWERWPLADLAYDDKSLRATDATIAELY